MTPHDLLLSLDPWLHSRCRRLAAELPGERADDLYPEVVEEFLRELGRWLQQAPTVSLEAQARSLMSFCIRHARTRAIHERKRRVNLATEPGEDSMERFAHTVPPVESPGAREILAKVRSCTTPPCALCLLSLRLPVLVEMADAESAKTWNRGGSQAIPRPLAEAWFLYRDGLDLPFLVADDVLWKDHVGIAWYTCGPVAEIPTDVRRGAASKVERYANRGAEHLRNALLDDGDAP